MAYGPDPLAPAGRASGPPTGASFRMATATTPSRIPTTRTIFSATIRRAASRRPISKPSSSEKRRRKPSAWTATRPIPTRCASTGMPPSYNRRTTSVWSISPAISSSAPAIGGRRGRKFRAISRRMTSRVRVMPAAQFSKRIRLPSTTAMSFRWPNRRYRRECCGRAPTTATSNSRKTTERRGPTSHLTWRASVPMQSSAAWSRRARRRARPTSPSSAA